MWVKFTLEPFDFYKCAWPSYGQLFLNEASYLSFTAGCISYLSPTFICAWNLYIFSIFLNVIKVLIGLVHTRCQGELKLGGWAVVLWLLNPLTEQGHAVTQGCTHAAAVLNYGMSHSASATTSEHEPFKCMVLSHILMQSTPLLRSEAAFLELNRQWGGDTSPPHILSNALDHFSEEQLC